MEWLETRGVISVRVTIPGQPHTADVSEDVEGLPSWGMPIIHDSAQRVFLDSVSSDRRWYLPEYLFEPMAPSGEGDESTFSFTAESVGLDEDNVEAYAVRIEVVLRKAMPRELSEDSDAFPVPETVNAKLMLPFADGDTGKATVRSIVGDQRPDDGLLRVNFAVAGSMARVAYGCLSGLRQGNAPTLEIELAFRGLMPAVDTDSSGRDAVWRDAQDDATSGELFVLERLPSLTDRSRDFSAAFVSPSKPAERDDVYRAVTINRTLSIPLLVPCNEFASSFTLKSPKGPLPIGCSEGFASGKVSGRLYEEVMEQSTESLRVFRSNIRPGCFMILPKAYRTSRRPFEEDLRPPKIRWIRAFDANADTELPGVLLASLAPDLRQFDLAVVAEALSKLGDARLLLPTSPGSGLVGVEVTWNIPQQPAVLVEGDDLRCDLNVSTYDEAEIISERLSGHDLNLLGNALFVFEDGTRLGPVELHLGVTGLAGPWPSGPISVEDGPNSPLLTNRSEGRAFIDRVAIVRGPDQIEVRDFPTPLDPVPIGGSVPIGFEAEATELVPSYRIASTPQEVEARRIYVEDMQIGLVIRGDVDLRDRSITRIDVEILVSNHGTPIRQSFYPSTPLIKFEFLQPLMDIRKNGMVIAKVRCIVQLESGQLIGGDFVAVNLKEESWLRLSRLVPSL